MMTDITETAKAATGNKEKPVLDDPDRQDDDLDAALAQTFPASDPVAVCMPNKSRNKSVNRR